jgi:glycine/D-amino acid oxidase-like deaminating enzyme
MARSSLELYLEVTADPPVPVHFDREPIGTLAVAIDEDDAAMVREEAAAAGRAGLRAERLDAAGLRELEPELTADVFEAWLFHEGRRVDPGALTLALAELARRAGASIRHHLPGRRLLTRGESVTGVATDDGLIECDAVVLAAGPWSTGLLRPLGIHIPVSGARGWLIQLAPPRPLLSHWVEGSARTLWRREVEPVTASEFSEGVGRDDIGAVIQPSPDGTIVAGTSREPALAWSAEDLHVARAVAGCVIRLLPALADAPMLGTWSGIRPMSPDERPFIGWLRPGLFAATGHGSEGVILGGGTAMLVTAMVLGREPPLEPTPFDPLRFG